MRITFCQRFAQSRHRFGTDLLQGHGGSGSDHRYQTGQGFHQLRGSRLGCRAELGEGVNDSHAIDPVFLVPGRHDRLDRLGAKLSHGQGRGRRDRRIIQ